MSEFSKESTSEDFCSAVFQSINFVFLLTGSCPTKIFSATDKVSIVISSW